MVISKFLSGSTIIILYSVDLLGVLLTRFKYYRGTRYKKTAGNNL